MAKYIEVERAQEILHSHKSNSQKIKALSQEGVVDNYDIRNPYTWLAGLILGLFTIYCMFKFGAVCNI